jgi:hypothetical protein
MEQSIPLNPISPNSFNRPHPFSKIEPSYPWIRYIVSGTTVGSIFGLVILILMLAIPISMLVIGVRYRDPYYCPIEPRLSHFLIVSGAVLLVWIIIVIFLSLVTMFFGYTSSKISLGCVFILSIKIFILLIFLIIWLIVGSIWTFSIRNRVEYTINHPFHFYFYCHKTLYQFTFVYLIILFIFIPLLICFRCCTKIFRSKR